MIETWDKEKRPAPRFDFGNHEVESAKQTGTLKELLDELDEERGGCETETKLSIHSLRHILPFLGRLSGKEYTSTRELLPVTTLKTIKLLYVENRRLNPKTSHPVSQSESKPSDTLKEKGIHLLDLIETPTADRASMESATGTTVAPNKRGRDAIERLCSQLALEIPAEKLELANLFFSQTQTRTTSEGIISYIEYTNDAIYREMTNSIPDDPKVLGSAFTDLSKIISCAQSYKIRDDVPKTPLHEQLYIHLQSLGFIHFVLHHQRFVKNTLVKPRSKRPNYNAVKDLLMALCHAIGDDVTPDAQLFCLSDVFRVIEKPSEYDKHLIDKYSGHFRHVVEKITGLSTKPNSLLDYAPRVEKILRIYALRRFDSTDRGARNLTIHDIVAALCSFRYQQEAKTTYQPKWFSQEVSEGRNIKNHFDKGLQSTLSSPKPFVYQGVFQIYYNRFAQYKAALDRTTSIYQGWMSFQYARLHAYINILKLRSIHHVSAAACCFDELCKEEARNIVNLHTSRSLM